MNGTPHRYETCVGHYEETMIGKSTGDIVSGLERRLTPEITLRMQ